MEILIAAAMFIGIVLFIEGIYFLLETRRTPEKRKVRERLASLSQMKLEGQDIDILRKTTFSQIPWFDRLLSGMRWTDSVNLLLEQGAVKRTLGVYVMLTVVLVFAGFVAASSFTSNLFILMGAAALLGVIPFLYIYFKKKKRMAKFGRQLPDAVELIARSLKAGHAFTGGLKLVSGEMDDPIGTEFYKTLNEINFGVAVNDALKNLASRIDCPDIKFFCISVMVQRETGGNLAEILENIGRLIRERFKLYGKIRVLSAQGKLSAVVLIALPFVVAFGLSIINPGYLETLFLEPIGRMMMIFALILMVLGILVIKKMVAIRV